MIKIHGGFALRYAVFSLTALFLTACGDSDNPVVYTAPAGKAVDEEVKQPPGTNYGSYEEIPYVPVDPPETAAHTKADDPNTNVNESIHTQSEIDRHRTDPLPSASACDSERPAVDRDGSLRFDSNGNQIMERYCWWDKAGRSELLETVNRHEQLVEDEVLPTITVSGCLNGNNAIFTFRRTGPTTEGLSFAFNFSRSAGGLRVNTGFGAGNDSFGWNGGAVGSGAGVVIEPGWESSMTGDYNAGASATVTSSTGPCQ